MSRDTEDSARGSESDYETDAAGISRRRALQGVGAGLLGTVTIAGTTQTASADEDDTAGGESIGGGEGYDRIVTEDDADAVVDTADGLDDALEDADEGEVVFVDGDATIDTDDREFDVPAGVTLASDRGREGAEGALLTTDEEPDTVVRVEGDDARVTGLRLHGPHTDTDVSDDDGISFDNRSAKGISVAGADGEIDNVDVAGFTFAGVVVENYGDGGQHIHHNYIHGNNTQTVGYGVSVGIGDDLDPTVEFNYFDANRHSVTATGENYGYTARYNHFGPTSVMHPIDIHDPGSQDTTIENNVVETRTRTWDGNDCPAIGGFDGTDGVVSIQDNWFWNDDDTFDVPTDDGGVEVDDNYYGEDDDVDFADAIPNHPGAEDRPWG